ncbi:endonuclease/exonuclease/phosphatase family protein, partial [Acinetobacter baumannii]
MKTTVINLVHQNLQGLMGKELEIDLFLDYNKVHVLCVTEHWLKKYELNCNFKNHQVMSSFCRENAIRGGSLIFVNKDYKCKERRDIVSLSVERIIEMACVELERFIVVSVYRPPNSLYDSFENILEHVLLKLSVSNKHIFICGDFNINLLENTNATIRFRTLLKSYNLSNLFSEPTRKTSTSATCIDNIFTNVKPLHKYIINH